MDYDDNDFESHNRQLAGEGSSKFPIVLRPYALPKFDFDDSLQGHLRFDNLVETEVFLGIESQEDNRWIEDFSQGSSRIEFTSSAAESCPISRHNNVWSEATSSESVEMLLKSVGQEEMIPGQTIIKESDACGCDQLGSSTKQIEPSLKQDDNILSSVQDVIDSGPTLPPDKLLESLSGLNEGSGGLPQVGDISHAHEGESSGQGNSRDLDPDVIGEQCDFPVVEGNQVKEGKFNDANQREVVSLCNENLHNRTLEDFSASKMQIDNLVISMQTSSARIGESNTEEIMHQAIYTSDANEAFNENDHDGEGELHALSKEAQIDDQNTHECALKSGAYNVEKPLDVAFQMKSVGEQNTVETLVNVEPSSSMIVLGNSDLEMVEGCSVSACPVIPAQDSKCEVRGLTEDTHIGDHLIENMHERSPVALEGYSNFEVHTVDIDDTTSGIGANIDLKMQTEVQIKDGQGSVSERMEYLEESGKQMNSVISVSKPEVSLLFVEGNKLFEGQCEQSINSVLGDTSSSEVVCFSAELKARGNGTLEGLPDTLRVSGEGLTGEGLGSSHLAKFESCEENLVPGQGDVSNSEQGYGSVEDEVIVCKDQSGTTAGNRFASDDSLKNADFTSNDTLDDGPISSGNNVTSLEAVNHKDDEKLTSHVGGITQLDNKEEVASEISVEASLLILNECSQLLSEQDLVSESGNDACCDTAGELNNGALDQSQKAEKCNTASGSESQEAEADKVGDSHSNEQETCLVPFDSTIKEDVVALVALKSREEETAKEILEEASPKVSDADKPTGGSPTVSNCAEMSMREKETQMGVKGPLDQNVTLTDIITGDLKKDCSVSQDVKDDVSKDQMGFSFDVSSLADLDKRDAEKSWHQSTMQASEMTLSVERSPSVSGLGQVDSRKAQKISNGIPQATNGEILLGGSKGTPERKARRASGRSAGKESAKKGNHVKGTTSVRQLEQVDKSCVVSPGYNLNCQIMQSEGMQHTGHVEQSSKKPANITTPISILPDLNTSASLLAVFQQPFTDLQQVQLRAQIFVYGSLIQGTTPEEAWMISAFGGLDGGRSIWDNAWRLSVERLRDQKSNSSNPETPLQPLSGAKVPDHSNKQGALQSKMIYSPAGLASSKSITPSPIVNSIIPLSSPLWSISTPSGDVRQSCVNPRSAVMDPNQAPSPLHPYLTPAIRSFVGQTWVSQPPFPCPWVTSPQATAFDSSLRFSTLPITESVKLTPVRESSGPHASSVKHVSPSPIVHSGRLTSVHQGISMIPDVTKATVSAGQESANPKSKKRKKAPASEDLGHISLPPQIRTYPVSASGVASHFSTSVVVATPPMSKTTQKIFVPAASTTSSSDQSKIANRDVEQKVILSEETLNNVKEAKLEAENAATLAAAAVNHCQLIWDQLDKQKNSGMTVDGEAKLASAAVAIAAAASVAKAAAAAAKVAADAALQAKLMAEEAMIASGVGSSGQNNIVSLSNDVNILGDATPASILKGQGGMDSSGSIIIAAREAARRRVEAASASSKQAENLNAIVKAAELAIEAVTQAGKVVAMGNPLSLSELVEAGPEGYWRVSQVPSELAVKSNNNNTEQSNTESVKHGSESSAQHVEAVTFDDKETRTTSYGKPPTPRDISMVSMEDHMRFVDGSSGFVTRGERDLRGQKGSKVSELTKTVGVFPDSNSGSRYTSSTVQNNQEKAVGTVEGNSIKEGSLVEVFKDGDGSKAAWFLASVSSLKDGEAYVSYTEIPSGEGSGQLKEWVPLNAEGDKAPRVRIPHPITTMQFEGAKKRRRAAMGNYNWSVGDKVDACIQDCWCEGVVTEKNKKDETTLSVHFPAQGETSIVRAWQLRPSVLWKDGQWIEWSTLRENDPGSLEGDTPREKRLKLGSPAAESKEKERVSTDIGVVESRVAEETRLLDLCANDKIFNIGRNTRDESKPDASRVVRSGLQKEGPRVIFGVPKPGKKRKFMEVSKHYVADKSIKASGGNDSVKLAKVPMPQGSGSRGWRNTKFNVREKQPAESKPRVLKTGKTPSVPTRSVPQKINLLTSAVSAPHDGIMTDHRANLKDSVGLNENASVKQRRANFGSFPNNEGTTDGPFLFSSLPVPPDAVSSKKVSSSNSKSERASNSRVAPSGGKLAKIQEDKVYNGNDGKSVPEVVEPRRSIRRIQPTSRLLEGLQSSLSITKIPTLSHDRGLKVQNKSASSSRGNNHG